MQENPLSGILMDESAVLSVDELCRACAQQSAWVIELVEEGILEPIAGDRKNWRFSAVSLRRAHVAMRLQRDLGINIAGVALALDLLEEVGMLRARLPERNPSHD